MRIKYVIFMIVLMSLVTACIGRTGPMETVRGSGNVITEEREVSGFTAVSLQGVGELVIDQTGRESLTITADDNLLPYIETQVRGGKLIISIQDNVLFNNVTGLTYHVTVNTIESIELDGAGNIQVSDLDNDDWRVTLAGTGNITVAGQVDTQTVQIDGAGAYTADELASRETIIEQNGAGMVVQVSEQLTSALMAWECGNIYAIRPSPKSINGLGTVRQR